jgi:epoxyqueuosine reductase
MTPSPNTIREIAHHAGFDLVAFGPADLGEHGEHFAQWLDAGRAGEMDYLHRNREVILDPKRFLPDAASTISLAYDYGGPQETLAGGQGKVARYAKGRDYHRFLGKATRRMRADLERAGLAPGTVRVGTDAVPVLERALASRAGIGFLAKSAGIISPTLGPYLLLSELITQAELPYDPPALGSCGSCTACLDACPTQAITAPHQVDATRCLSYTTIELRGFIEEPLRRAQGDHFFGCDICLEVCPFTSKGRNSHSADVPADMQPHAVLETFDLVGVLELSEQDYQQQWVGTAMRRATRTGLRRNAAVVLGNLGDPSAGPTLAKALKDPDPVIRGHAAWALGRLQTQRLELSNQLETEADARVIQEISAALQASG